MLLIKQINKIQEEKWDVVVEIIKNMEMQIL